MKDRLHRLDRRRDRTRRDDPDRHGEPRASAPGKQTLVDQLYGDLSHQEAQELLDAGLGDAARLIAGGGGAALDSGERSEFEPLLGISLAGVRVHDGAAAHAVAARLDARAWAYGDHVVLGGGIAADERRSVLAHELAHVASQRGMAPGSPRRVGADSDPVEAATDRAAVQMMWGRPASVPADHAGAIRPLPPTRQGAPLIITASSFRDASVQFMAIANELNDPRQFRMIVLGATTVQVFDNASNSLGTFRLTSPAPVSTGVHVMTSGRGLHPLIRRGDTYVPAAGLTGGSLDYAHSVENQEAFNATLHGGTLIYIVPAAAPEPPAPPPAPSATPDPLAAFTPTGTANARPWPGAVVPLTPQVTGTHTTGSFLMRLQNNMGDTTLERVTNLMQPVSYRWEVLQLDDHLRPRADIAPRAATRLDAARDGFDRRHRDLAADRRTTLGEHPERQSVSERVIRRAVADAVGHERESLAMAGQVVMTIVHVLTGGPENPFSEDIIDVPFPSAGTFYVRCLATPVSRPGDQIRRGTTVAGASVTVFDMATFAGDALGTVSDDEAAATARIAAIDATLTTGPDESDTSPRAENERTRQRAFLPMERTFAEATLAAHGDERLVLAARRAYLNARIAWLASDGHAVADATARHDNDTLLRELRAEERRIGAQIDNAGGRLGADATHVANMRAMLVDETSGGRSELQFAIGERSYLISDRFEVRIADVTDAASGRTFTGQGAGQAGGGRAEAWRAAMRDLRANLHRGRGYLGYRVPAAYAAIDLDLPNPMQLQMSLTDQIVEMTDDAAHVMSLAAVLAAPMTGGGSLAILGVIAPFQAATSAYRLLDRAAYGDLHLDTQAVSDFINIASFGLSSETGVSEAGTAVSFVRSSQRVAVLLLDGGNYLVMSVDLFDALTAPDAPGSDPREGRRRRVQALLQAMEAGGMAAAAHAYHDPAPPTPRAEHPTAPDAHPTTPEEHPRTDEPTAPATPGAPAAPVDHAALRAGLPPDLSATPIRSDLPGTTVRVEYTVTDGLVTEIRLRVGREATAAHIAEHVATIRAMERYRGFSGRVRTVLDRITAWMGGHPEARVGSLAWEARLEVQKLPPIIEARMRELARSTLTPEHRAALVAEVADLESQLARHQANVDTIIAEPGRGFVAAEGMSTGAAVARERGIPEPPEGYHWRFRDGELILVSTAGGPQREYVRGAGGTPRDYPIVPEGRRRPAPSFDPGTSQAVAYDSLEGHDPASPFGRFTHMLIREGLAPNHDALIERLRAPGGLTYDTVREGFKASFREQLMRRISHPDVITTLPAYAERIAQGLTPDAAFRAVAEAEMVRVTSNLYSSDRGSIAEEWYARVHADPEARTQVPITIETARALGVTIPDNIRIDRVAGNTIEEMKHVTGRLDREDLSNITSALALCGREIPLRGGGTRRIDNVRVIFLDPAGVVPNAREFYSRLAPGRVGASELIVEIHAATGASLTLTSDNRAILNDPTRLATFVETGRDPGAP